MPNDEPAKIAVLISGGGTTLKNLIDFYHRGKLDVEIGLVVSSNRRAVGNQFAIDNGIELQIVQRRDHKSTSQFSQAIFALCRERAIGLVVMGGFLKKVEIPGDFENRVINIHPSLIPEFCGQGMYGMHVHRAVINANAKTTGCTVHFVDNEYDHGPIIMQRSIDVRDEDTPESLHARVFTVECEVYPIVINAIAKDAGS